ncbi:hypothetical protein LTR56_004019 [Elasticomyces elasticus]|nr:hypothetical protein LTR56_004019 [Elasticomyces elasticus]
MARTKQVARKLVVQTFPMPHYGINSDGPSSVQEKPASPKRSTDDGGASRDDDSDIDLGTAKRLRPTLPTFADELQKENEALLVQVATKLPQLESDSLAMDLLIRLVGRSYGDLATRAGHEYGDRPSDAAADGLFCTLARERRKRDPSWDFRPVLAQLKATAAGPAEVGGRLRSLTWRDQSDAFANKGQTKRWIWTSRFAVPGTSP